MATPVVSAAAALLIQANPAMTPDQVKARLMIDAYKSFPTSSEATDPTTGNTYISYYDIFTVGAGYVDIAAALEDKSLAQGNALSPTAVYDSATGTVGIVTDPASVWNLSGVWGTQSVYDLRTVWGANSIDASRTVWGSKTVWGANSVSSSRSVWGAGVNLNGPTAQSMSSGTTIQPSSTTAAQATSMNVPANGEK
jgi:serine protease AprX